MDFPSSIPLPEEKAGIIISDPLTFWSLKPAQKVNYKGACITTNMQGFRGEDPLQNKIPGEYRILSLGESSTLGVKVEDNQTYSAMLETKLNDKYSDTTFKVINAGVSAWSSWQSYQFLLHKGLKLNPDAIIFYHELNDFLPSSLRSYKNSSPFSAVMTDKELSESLLNKLSRFLIANSDFVRKTTLFINKRKFNSFKEERINNLTTIGLPDTGIGNRLRWHQSGEKISDLREQNLPPRVSPDERRWILSKIISICQQRKIDLVFVHPCYKKTKIHSCVLTETLERHNVNYLDLVKVFQTMDKNKLFIDAWHPTVAGHEIIADMLAEHLGKFSLRGSHAKV